IYKDNRYNERDAIRENENYARNENIEYTDAYEDLTHGFSPALNMFIRHSKGAGFTNVDIDSDGTRRRIQLLNKYPEGYAAQLAFAPLLKKLDARSVIRDGSSIIVSGVKLDEDSGRQDIKIPLDEHGRMMINWKHASYGETFRHQKIYHLYYLDQLENSFADNSLILLNAASSIDPDAETNTALASISELAELYDQLADYKKFLLSKCEGYDEEGNTIGEGITDEEYKEYFDARKTYFTMADEFIHSDAFDLLNAKLDSRKKAFSKDDFSLLKETLSDLQESMTFTVADYNDLYNTIEKEYKGSFCIIGNTGSATTDLGTTPFNRRYPNVGTHANMYNTIVNREFIVPAPWWSGVAAAFILAFLLAAFSQKRKVFAINIAGVCTLLLITGGIIALMAFLGVYVPAIAPVLIVLLSFISIEILHFVRSEKDKSFLKHAFATYLNPKSVDELVAHPERLSLGGDQKHMTALFSDIKGFSSFSEKVTPIQLVNVLKTYLGDLSDCVLDAGGTID
ncbi:MAG: CHASE2 domain-containing protein, partial [Treponema sp.]|nr:CHASE2 domain-containing protein [Treponema sp.]